MKPQYQSPDIYVYNEHLLMNDVLVLSDASGIEEEWELEE